MVPGFAERERRIADAQRRIWLAEAHDRLTRRRPLQSVACAAVIWRRAWPSPGDLIHCLRRNWRKSFTPVMAR